MYLAKKEFHKFRIEIGHLIYTHFLGKDMNFSVRAFAKSFGVFSYFFENQSLYELNWHMDFSVKANLLMCLTYFFKVFNCNVLVFLKIKAVYPPLISQCYKNRDIK